MKRKCVVPGCHNHSDNVKSLMFHIFPADDTLRQIWVDWIHSLPADEDYEMPEDFEDSYICGVHFGPEDDYGEGDDLEEKIPSIHLAPAAAASARASEPTTAEEDNTRDTMNNFNDNNGETEGEAEQTEPEADQTEPEPDTEGEGARSEIPDDGSDEDDELPLQARIKAESGISDYEPDEDMEDDDSDPSFDPSDPRTSTIKPVTGGRGRKSTARYSEPAPAPKKRGRKPKAQTPEPKEPKRNKRKSQPKKVTKRPTKRELKMREIEYDTDEAADEENNQNRSNKQSGGSSGGSGQPEIPESITLALNSSNSRIVGLTEEIENCHRIIKEKNELINKLNLNNNELSSKLKYFTQSEFSIKLTSVITEASKGDTRAVYLLDQIRKYNSVAASNTVYVALPSTSAALSTAAAQSVIQEQIQQQQQQQQTSQRSSSSHSNHNPAHQQQHSSQQAQAQAQQQAAAQQQAQQQAAAAAAAQQQAVAAAAAAVNNNALYNQYQQSLAAQQLQLPFQTFTADHLAYHNQRFQ